MLNLSNYLLLLKVQDYLNPLFKFLYFYYQNNCDLDKTCLVFDTVSFYQPYFVYLKYFFYYMIISAIFKFLYDQFIRATWLFGLAFVCLKFINSLIFNIRMFECLIKLVYFIIENLWKTLKKLFEIIWKKLQKLRTSSLDQNINQ